MQQAMRESEDPDMNIRRWEPDMTTLANLLVNKIFTGELQVVLLLLLTTTATAVITRRTTHVDIGYICTDIG
jgi:hypothetical protein